MLYSQLSGRFIPFQNFPEGSQYFKAGLGDDLAFADVHAFVRGAPPEAAGDCTVGTEFDSIRGRGGDDGTPLRHTPWGEIADSPGVRDYSPPVVPLSEIQHGFPEIAARARECRFQDCLHLREPQCAVQAAVESGAIDARRYESYRRLSNLTRQLDERRGWGD